LGRKPHRLQIIEDDGSDGSPLLAIPNFARENRAAENTLVWLNGTPSTASAR